MSLRQVFNGCMPKMRQGHVVSMRLSLAIASVCILACIALADAQQPLPPNMQIVQLQDLSQARE
jgi:hypothetical protein